MRIFAIDPGTSESAYVVWDGEQVRERGYLPNEVIRRQLINREVVYDLLAIERVQFYGKGGNELRDTIEWVGRFDADQSCRLIIRAQIRAHLCGTTKSGDAELRAAILDRFGGRAAAVGTKKEPGPLYGISKHEWAALGVALTAWDLEQEREPV
jgi:hypothetical protein